jgi:glycosyltransferase involved in cell wall biosynthesis
MDVKARGTDKIRILLVIRWPVGGIRTFIRYVYNNFNRSRYHVTMIGPDIPELRVLLADLDGFDIVCKTFRSGASSLGIAAMVLKTVASERFDILHSQGFTAGLCSALPARLKKVKHIMTSHDILSERQFKGFQGFLKKKVLSFLLPLADVIHSVSKDAHDNLLDVGRFSGHEKRDLRRELNLHEDSFIIGFMGRFMSQKGFIHLLEAMEILNRDPDLLRKPVIAAFGFGGFVRETKRIVRDKKLESSVFFMPFTENSSSAIKGFDVLAMPSLWEAFGLLAAEAMTTGTPVIGTDCIGLREVLHGTPGIMVPPGDSKALAKALANEIRNPTKKAAAEFQKSAMSRFDVRRQAAELQTIMLNLIRS